MLLIAYSAEGVTLRLVHDELKAMSGTIPGDILVLRSTEITERHIRSADTVLSVRPFDTGAAEIVRFAHCIGKKVIIYLDDDLLHLPEMDLPLPRRIAFRLMQQSNCRALRKALAECDVLWGSNPLLLNRYSDYLREGRTVCTDITADIERMKEPMRTGETTRFLYAASRDHIDLLNVIIIPALNKVAKAYPNISLTCMGMDSWQAQSCHFDTEFLPWTSDYDQYRRNVEEKQFNIGLAPLGTEEFYQYKYFNKYIEYSLAGAIGIYSRQNPYLQVVKDKENGLLADANSDSWAEQILYAIRNPEKCLEMVMKAQEDCRRRFRKEQIAASIREMIPEFNQRGTRADRSAIERYRPPVLINHMRLLGEKALNKYDQIIEGRKQK